MATTDWNWLGDHLAVDLANTVIRRGHAMTELLDTPAALAEWLRLERHRVPVPDPVDDDLLARLLPLRDATFALLRAAEAGEALPPEARRTVNTIARQLPVVRVLDTRAGSVTAVPADDADTRSALLATLAAAVVDLLGDPALHDLAFCDAPSCGQFFHRRRTNQAWCCTACGDRVRAARHHARRTGQPTARGPR